MSKQNELSAALSDQIGLDELITVKDEYTTIRKEHRIGYVTGVQVDDGRMTGRGMHRHWALIDGQSFPVSAEEHAFLQGESSPHPT